MYFCLKSDTLIGIYNLTIEVVNLFFPVFGFFNRKLKKGIEGRKKTFDFLRQNISVEDTVFWFHCASLGEYEQGLPVFESLKKKNPNSKIVLSFFSPSGYEIRKKNPITPLVVYLPLDTKKNVSLFLELTHPKLVVFVKYDLWPNYLRSLKTKSIHTILISALFRKNQYFFSFFGGNSRALIFSFNHIFTQNNESKKLLNSIGYHSVTVSNDTRFDRVSNQLKLDNSLPVIEQFLNGEKALVAGSTWPEDDEIILPYINTIKHNLKFIIAPHNINPNYIRNLKQKLGNKAVLFSNYDKETLSKKQILIVDCIGILTKLYSYASIAYVGGGMGNSGLHNTLEAAVFGIPIIIGKNYNKFPEAKAMIQMGGLKSVSNKIEFKTLMGTFFSDPKYCEECGTINKSYVDKNKGATDKILSALESQFQK